MSALQSPPALLRMTLQITRAETGETETVELVGIPVEPSQEKEEDVRHSPDCV